MVVGPPPLKLMDGCGPEAPDHYEQPLPGKFKPPQNTTFRLFPELAIHPAQTTFHQTKPTHTLTLQLYHLARTTIHPAQLSGPSLLGQPPCLSCLPSPANLPPPTHLLLPSHDLLLLLLPLFLVLNTHLHLHPSLLHNTPTASPPIRHPPYYHGRPRAPPSGQ